MFGSVNYWEGGAGSHWSESAMEVKEVHFLKSADEDNLKNPRWGGVEGREVSLAQIFFNLVLLALVNSYIVGYIKGLSHINLPQSRVLSESNISFS